MKKFRFTFDTVMRVKRNKEETFQRELGVLLAKKLEAEGRLLSLAEQREELQQYQRSRRLQKQRNLVEENLFMVRQVDYLNQMDQQRHRILELEELCSAKRQELVEASKEKRVFEKLEERQKRDYLVRAGREEQGFLDELSQHQFATKAF